MPVNDGVTKNSIRDNLKRLLFEKTNEKIILILSPLNFASQSEEFCCYVTESIFISGELGY